jgi:N-acetylglucosamine-6-phosphate deacetylase
VNLLLRNCRLVLPDRVVDAWVACEDGIIVEVGSGHRSSGIDLQGQLVLPGFVDMHVHGATGSQFADGHDLAARRVVDYHLQHGTTTALAGVTGAGVDALVTAASGLTETCEAGTVAGIYFEGPFLSNARRGAHRPEDLHTPDLQALERLSDAAPGHLQMMTIAPELPGALEVIAALTQGGRVAAVGHTDATLEQARAAFSAGATVATHLFNGMRPIHHRDPGVAVAALMEPSVVCEIIADGFHVDFSLIAYAFATAGPHRIALVTDAIAFAGVGDGHHGDAGHDIVVTNGMAMLADGSSLAGSTLTMDAAVAQTVRRSGVKLPDAVQAASRTPARALGLDDRVGSIAPGLRADFVIMDSQLSVQAVMRAGTWVTGPWAN